MILIIDNYDSFTYNLVQYIGFINQDLKVYRNDEISQEKIRKLKPKKIVISPGPGRPEDAGNSVQIVNTFGSEIPILGICLGLQAIVVSFGGSVSESEEVMHGKSSIINHYGSEIFNGVPNQFEATRYHSLIADEKNFPDNDLNIIARTDNGLIMGLQHKVHLIFGLQFHPESIVTTYGQKMIKNFLDL